MTYMGIDQSITGTGICINKNDEYQYYLIGTEKTKNTKCPTIDRTRRIIQLKEEVRSIIQKHKPDIICMEGMAFGAGGTSSLMDIGGLSHLFREAFIETNINFIIVPPTVIKKFWTGKGNANKMLMIETAESKDVNIPYTKKYSGKVRFNDNVVDAHAMCEFLKVYQDYLDTIECSWDV